MFTCDDVFNVYKHRKSYTLKKIRLVRRLLAILLDLAVLSWVSKTDLLKLSILFILMIFRFQVQYLYLSLLSHVCNALNLHYTCTSFIVKRYMKTSVKSLVVFVLQPMFMLIAICRTHQENSKVKTKERRDSCYFNSHSSMFI